HDNSPAYQVEYGVETLVLLDGELSIDNSMAHGRRTIMPFAAHRMPRLVLGAIAVLLWTTVAFAQTATVTHNVNLRSDASTSQPPIRLLTPSEPSLTVLDPTPSAGYLHVRTANNEDGGVCG